MSDIALQLYSIRERITTEGLAPSLASAAARGFDRIELFNILEWADDLRRLRVRANADTPEDAVKAREFGAEGIGLCRTEHMFMAPDRLPVVREMIMAENEDGRRTALGQNDHEHR